MDNTHRPMDKKRWFDAAWKGKTQTIQLMLSQGAQIDAEDAQGWTAATFASFNGHPECLAALLDAGASIDRRDAAGWTAFMTACCWGNAKWARLLIQVGCDIDASNPSGQSALDLAVESRREECVALLLDARAARDAIVLSRDLNQSLSGAPRSRKASI